MVTDYSNVFIQRKTHKLIDIFDSTAWTDLVWNYLWSKVSFWDRVEYDWGQKWASAPWRTSSRHWYLSKHSFSPTAFCLLFFCNRYSHIHLLGRLIYLIVFCYCTLTFDLPPGPPVRPTGRHRQRCRGLCPGRHAEDARILPELLPGGVLAAQTGWVAVLLMHHGKVGCDMTGCWWFVLLSSFQFACVCPVVPGCSWTGISFFASWYVLSLATPITSCQLTIGMKSSPFNFVVSVFHNDNTSLAVPRTATSWT